MTRLWHVLGVIALASAWLAVGCTSSAPASSRPAAAVSTTAPAGTAAPTQADGVSSAYAVGAANSASSPTPSASGAVGSTGTSPTSQTGTSGKEFVSAQRVGDLQVKLRITPFPPVNRNASSFEVTLANASGQAVSDAQVTLDLTMPAMPMPPNHPTAQAAGDGRYTASARMLMPGEWWVTVIIRQGDKEQRVAFKGANVP